LHPLQGNDQQSGDLKGDYLAAIDFWLRANNVRQPAAGGVRSASRA
jgi:hypothetical protein